MNTPTRKIVNGLRYGPMSPADLATMLNLPPYLVRAELKKLKRDQLAHEILTTERHVYELTRRGWDELYAGDQLQLPEVH